jgi:hypothetical protein
MNRLALVATAGLLLTACGGSTQIPTVSSQSVKTVTVTQPTKATTTYAVAPTAIATPSGPKSAIETDGTYLVGSDILPGIYRTTGGSNCYWARLSSLNTSDIINNNNSSGPQVVEILPTDRAFLTENCQPWSLASAPPSIAATAPPVSQGGALMTLPGADTQGFSNGPRCSYRAALMVRTALSQAVVCDEGSGTYTYKGLRLKDQGRIDLSGALPTANGFTVSNSDGTRYDISRSGLVITTAGDVYTEQALASGP